MRVWKGKTPEAMRSREVTEATSVRGVTASPPPASPIQAVSYSRDSISRARSR